MNGSATRNPGIGCTGFCVSPARRKKRETKQHKTIIVTVDRGQASQDEDDTTFPLKVRGIFENLNERGVAGAVEKCEPCLAAYSSLRFPH